MPARKKFTAGLPFAKGNANQITFSISPPLTSTLTLRPTVIGGVVSTARGACVYVCCVPSVYTAGVCVSRRESAHDFAISFMAGAFTVCSVDDSDDNVPLGSISHTADRG